MSSTIKGDLYGTAILEDGKEINIILQNVKYTPDPFCNLISLTTVPQKGFKLSRDESGLYLKKSNATYNFNKKIKNGEGQLIGKKIIKCTDEIAAIRMGLTHAVLGHPSYLLTSSTATKLGMRSMRANEICESSTKGKQRQKKMNKTIDFKAVNSSRVIF